MSLKWKINKHTVYAEDENQSFVFQLRDIEYVNCKFGDREIEIWCKNNTTYCLDYTRHDDTLATKFIYEIEDALEVFLSTTQE